MTLSEDEIERRLAALRRRREAIDREITDLVLYLELGRRLGAGPPPAEDPEPRASTVRLSAAGDDARIPVEPGAGPGGVPESDPFGGDDELARPSRGAVPPGRPAGREAARSAAPRRAAVVPQAVPFAEDPTAARRYGRALVAASCEAIARAGRPLHAREIHAELEASGFTVPGRDPVAALNTRLWKRAGEGGPLRRLGDAVYGLAGADA